MDVFSALQTAVSGLRAQGYSLDNISGNIANSQTTGFKRVDTSFVDLIPEQPSNRAVAGSVAAYSRLTNTLQGGVLATGIPTNMALSGDGYFAVQARTGESGSTSSFAGPEYYTRRGDFALDKSGYLVNGAGYYLKGATIDPLTGLAQGAASGVIQVSNAPLPAQATTTINYAANLPNTPTTSSGETLLAAPSGATFPPGYDPRIVALPATPGSGFVAASDAARFVSQSVAGGSLTAYTTTGSGADVQMRWAKVQQGDPAATPATEDVWNLFYQSNTTATGNAAAWQNIGTPFNFDATGKITSPAGGTVTIPNLTVNGIAVGDVALSYGTNGLTSYASSGGLVTTTTLQQDGYASGTLDSLAVTSEGKVVGSYSNGRTVALAQVGIMQFNADNGLKRENSGVYSQTLESGPPIAGLNGSSIVGGNVEQSNTDIAEEFSKMIVTQQAYSANTKVMSTAQQMIADILNVIR